MRVSVALFTADLRTHDNPVLVAALRDAERVVPLFVVDTGVRGTGFVVPNRAAFLADSLADLDGALRARGGRLVVRVGDVVEETCRVAAETGAGEVHIAAGVSRYAARREDRLRAELAGDRRALRVHEASVTAVPPGALTPAGKDHFAVFTPYFRRWESFAVRGVLPAPDAVPVPDVRSAGLPSAGSLAPGPASPGLPAGGESEARRRLRSWLAGPLSAYDDRHDDLAADATSRLSAHLHFGCLSPTELLHRARAQDNPGAHAFVRQLAWRDFHHQVLAARPDAADHDYRPRHDRWRHAPEETEAWREGRTGYPLVDAALRQLRHEGWMPGRARLLAASFLVKTLYVDWRVGARHFLDLLVDGDIANNQLNWQWVAGTGTDTRPNRVLNPLVQARRFDPRGEYVRRWLPELSGLDARTIHRVPLLDTADRAGLDYPAPVVDLAAAAARFREGRSPG
ncbi:DNA photolyase family protein [Streptomyces sp. Go40/10]|uniref:cryptochrome/photolyase family protein n=1 Tax=Streptomyces sp. Go40/10 TaxID=2825844 RepID=UPI001E447275|nr:deoxyribodipyrimidine photo-lyase [Streptomyces sp. Go40/10]UFR03640.1 DNA photolyase family protein [Streptomyces sp. Go40/10]